jgi:hypothetical protein
LSSDVFVLLFNCYNGFMSAPIDALRLQDRQAGGGAHKGELGDMAVALLTDHC